jgi:hypothetical protein
MDADSERSRHFRSSSVLIRVNPWFDFFTPILLLLIRILILILISAPLGGGAAQPRRPPCFTPHSPLFTLHFSYPFLFGLRQISTLWLVVVFVPWQPIVCNCR